MQDLLLTHLTRNVISPALKLYPATGADAGKTNSDALKLDLLMQLVGPFPAWTTPISNVHATNVTNTAATITWSSVEATTSQIAYGLTDGYGQVSVMDPARVTEHSMTITGLIPGKTYHFKVMGWNEIGVGGRRVM